MLGRQEITVRPKANIFAMLHSTKVDGEVGNDSTSDESLIENESKPLKSLTFKRSTFIERSIVLYKC